MEPTFIPQALALLSRSRFMLCCALDLSVNIRLEQAASVPHSSEDRVGQGPGQSPAGHPIPILWQPTIRDVLEVSQIPKKNPEVPWR